MRHAQFQRFLLSKDKKLLQKGSSKKKKGPREGEPGSYEPSSDGSGMPRPKISDEE